MIIIQWQADRDWAEKYTEEIKAIIRTNLARVELASVSDDIHHATDLLVTSPEPIACRMRRPSCGFRDLTLRSWRSSGVRTELDKIRDGDARWYFYGWRNSADELRDWIIADLNALRASPLLDKETIYNPDGITGFIAITIEELEQYHCLVARGNHDEKPAASDKADSTTIAHSTLTQLSLF